MYTAGEAKVCLKARHVIGHPEDRISKKWNQVSFRRPTLVKQISKISRRPGSPFSSMLSAFYLKTQRRPSFNHQSWEIINIGNFFFSDLHMNEWWMELLCVVLFVTGELRRADYISRTLASQRIVF